MAFVIFDSPLQLPVGEMAKRLREAFPRIGWTVGDGAQDGLVSLERATSIIGRDPDGDMILLGIEQKAQPLPLDAGAPPHQVHVVLSGPSREDEEFASRMLLVVAGTLIWSVGRGQFQRAPGGRWYDARTVEDGLQRTVADAGRGQFSASHYLASHGSDGVTEPPARNAGDELFNKSTMDASFAAAVAQVMGPEMAAQFGYQAPPAYAGEEPRANRLPTFVLALAHPLTFDWTPYLDLGQFDPDGHWMVEPGPHGTGTLKGRGCSIAISASPDPIPAYMLDNARARSFWFTQADTLAQQTSSLVVTCDLDTRAARFEEVRETAKLMTVLLGLLSRAPGCIALLNNGIHTLLAPEMVQSQVGHLHKNQIPVMLWTLTAPDNMTRDNVCLSSGGLLPFLGYEIEVWNAPGDAQWVGEQMSLLINYLLHVGPVMKDGETFAETPGQPIGRVFHGTTKAQRHDPSVPVLFLEFDNPTGVELPKPDLAPRDEPPADNWSYTDSMALVARTVESGFPGAMIVEQLERVFPDFRWRIDSAAVRSYRLVGEGAGAEVRALVSTFALSLSTKLGPPPHRFFIDVCVGARGDRALARRVAATIASSCIIQVDPEAHFQLGAGGNWLTHEDALTAVSLPRHVKVVGDFDLKFGQPPARFAGIDPYLPGAAPPLPDAAADVYLGIPVDRTAPPPPPTPPATRPNVGFGRRGLFGRKGS